MQRGFPVCIMYWIYIESIKFQYCLHITHNASTVNGIEYVLKWYWIDTVQNQYSSNDIETNLFRLLEIIMIWFNVRKSIYLH